MNADGIIGANGGLQGYNLFAYCNNNPVMYSDPSGYTQEIGEGTYVESVWEDLTVDDLVQIHDELMTVESSVGDSWLNLGLATLGLGATIFGLGVKGAILKAVITAVGLLTGGTSLVIGVSDVQSAYSLDKCQSEADEIKKWYNYYGDKQDVSFSFSVLNGLYCQESKISVSYIDQKGNLVEEWWPFRNRNSACIYNVVVNAIGEPHKNIRSYILTTYFTAEFMNKYGLS